MTAPRRLAVLLSGSGRTLENLLDAIAAGRLAATVVLVVSSRPDVRGVAIARRAGVAVEVLPRDGRSTADWSARIFAACRATAPDLVVMAGFLHLVAIPTDFAGRVINIHPSLLPAFGGKGFHGDHVHRAVIDRGCTVSGCTVHLVDDEYDHGRILVQRTVPVLPDDSIQSLAARVFAAECAALPEAISRFRVFPSPQSPPPQGTPFMARSIGNSIADSLALSLDYANRLLKEVPSDRFARFATVGGSTVESNHPAFVLGHLALYGPRIVSQLGGTPTPLPAAFEKAFSKDAACTDDPTGTIYPAMSEVVKAFRTGCEEAIAALRSASDDTLQKPNPAEGRMLELFPTLASVQTFYAGGHMMMHLGQLSAWRRIEGMKPA